jgi:NAD(P)-dependent dehydrogenase (short-subunit alcohol dehydrogenase family)
MSDYRTMINLTGKVVVITGGSQGIGFACATAFRENGATVVIAARDPVTGEEAARRLEADYLPLEVADPGQVKELAKTIISRSAGLILR